ncbi:hypothetical protein ADU37_CDS07100 [Thermococcus sp. 2319x1]|uniref:Clp1/GlmU family protein n=1 Tax=Thermococcus sp. 2319x1 TaxID=1674923 RepID=UPI00073AB86C|nr:Clp1/GlmU family protein [Thermococcus sp. 2319x1]ALV62409.1 hypothetical protein ADU37_CDS07100 [Thermococcus sp. 2319x1]
MNKAKYTQEVPEDRNEVLKIIQEEKKPLKIMVLGGVDSGKTTLTVFLANELLSQGFRVAIVDSDVGQKGILPPALISLGFPDRIFTTMEEIKPVKHYFVGTITPDQFFGEMVTGVKLLVNEAMKKRADVIITDTTGLVHGAGVELKRMKIEMIKPDLVLALQRKEELEDILRPFENKTRVIRLAISENAKPHTREERRQIRKEKWKKYFETSSEYILDLRKFYISGTQMFQGKEISEEEKSLLESLFRWLIFHGRKIAGRYFVVKADIGSFPRNFDKNAMNAVDLESLSNLLIGFIDKDGFCLGLGILKLINFKELKAHVLTPLNENEIKNAVEIRFGRIRVREDGEELGLLHRDAL